MTTQDLIDILNQVEHKETEFEIRLPATASYHYDRFATISEVFHGVLEGGGYVVMADIERK
jgi:hypothetical protein